VEISTFNYSLLPSFLPPTLSLKNIKYKTLGKQESRKLIQTRKGISVFLSFSKGCLERLHISRGGLVVILGGGEGGKISSYVRKKKERKKRNLVSRVMY